MATAVQIVAMKLPLNSALVEFRRDFTAIFRFKMAEKKAGAGSKKKLIWSVDEEELLISCWSENDCLFNTSCTDYKRQDKKSLAREAIIKALADEYGRTFTGKRIQFTVFVYI